MQKVGLLASGSSYTVSGSSIVAQSAIIGTVVAQYTSNEVIRSLGFAPGGRLFVQVDDNVTSTNDRIVSYNVPLTISSTPVQTIPLTGTFNEPTFMSFVRTVSFSAVNDNGMADVQGDWLTIIGNPGATSHVTVIARDGADPSVPYGRSSEIRFDYSVSATSIYGTVFKDTNGDGLLQTNESPIEAVQLYIDINNNSVLDPGETHAMER